MRLNTRLSRAVGSIGIAVVLLLSMLAFPAPSSRAALADFPVDRGHFYTQAAGPGAAPGTGFALLDDDYDDYGYVIKMWSEFQRLGGVDVLGYPASRRFFWNGFICQATQRVILQWQPATHSVTFLNIMDLVTDAGKDDYLRVARQTPAPTDFKPEEQGLSFQQIVQRRYHLLDAYPAIKARFFGASDPLQLNGLPVAPVADMGDAYVLRAQRVILQQWKKDMPWAKAGTVTVALGGDIAKELGLIQAKSPVAIIPTGAWSHPTSGRVEMLKTNLPVSEMMLSPNYWARDELAQLGVTRKIQAIVIHYTSDCTCWQHGADGYPTLRGLLEGFSKPAVQLSSHYVVDRQGRIGLVVPEEDAAWHAGPIDRKPGLDWAWTKGEEDGYNGNFNSIGIEIINRNGNQEDYSEAQYKTVALLVKDIATRYNIPLDHTHIVGHQELERAKADPGTHWDWNRFMQMVRDAPG